MVLNKTLRQPHQRSGISVFQVYNLVARIGFFTIGLPTFRPGFRIFSIPHPPWRVLQRNVYSFTIASSFFMDLEHEARKPTPPLALVNLPRSPSFSQLIYSTDSSMPNRYVVSHPPVTRDVFGSFLRLLPPLIRCSDCCLSANASHLACVLGNNNPVLFYSPQ